MTEVVEVKGMGRTEKLGKRSSAEWANQLEKEPKVRSLEEGIHRPINEILVFLI